MFTNLGSLNLHAQNDIFFVSQSNSISGYHSDTVYPSIAPDEFDLNRLGTSSDYPAPLDLKSEHMDIFLFDIQVLKTGADYAPEIKVIPDRPDLDPSDMMLAILYGDQTVLQFDIHLDNDSYLMGNRDSNNIFPVTS